MSEKKEIFEIGTEMKFKYCSCTNELMDYNYKYCPYCGKDFEEIKNSGEKCLIKAIDLVNKKITLEPIDE